MKIKCTNFNKSLTMIWSSGHEDETFITSEIINAAATGGPFLLFAFHKHIFKDQYIFQVDSKTSHCAIWGSIKGRVFLELSSSCWKCHIWLNSLQSSWNLTSIYLCKCVWTLLEPDAWTQPDSRSFLDGDVWFIFSLQTSLSIFGTFPFPGQTPASKPPPHILSNMTSQVSFNPVSLSPDLIQVIPKLKLTGSFNIPK